MALPVYTMQAHGCDARNMLGGVETLKVPEKCVYVTLAQCGQLGKVNLKYKDLIDSIEKNDFTINNPVLYKTIIEKNIYAPIHVHYSEADNAFLKTYVNSHYFPFLAWQCDEHGDHTKKPFTHVMMLKSGLYKSNVPLIITDLPVGIQENVDNYGFKRIITKENTITEEMVRIIYEHSIYPTADQVISNLQKYKKSTYSFHDLESASGTISQRKLFDLYPGIYYNTACRGPCDEMPIYDYLLKPYELRRQQSEIANEEFPTLTNDHLILLPYSLDGPKEFLLSVFKSLPNFSIYILNDVYVKEASIKWESPVNLLGCNLDDAIKIKKRPNYIDIDVDYKKYPGLTGNCTIHIYYDVFKKNQDYDIDEIRRTIEKNHYTFVSFKDDELIMTKYFKDAYDELFVDDKSWSSWASFGGKTRRKKKTKRRTLRKKLK